MTRFDRWVDRLLLSLLPTFSRVLWWLPELIGIFLSVSLMVVTGLLVFVVPGVVVLVLAVRRVITVRRANRRAQDVVDQVDVDEDTVTGSTDVSEVSL